MSRTYLYVFVSLFSAVFAGAAEKTATISGVVTDPSGASVPNANVNLHQIAGSALLSTESDSSGRYELSGVAAGSYLLGASAPGLSMPRLLSLAVAAGETRIIELHLIVSAASSQVTVTAAGEPQSVDQVSKQLDVVNAADAEQRGIFSVAQAISFLPGVRVTTRGGPGEYTEIQTRGLRYIDTSILVDGFRFRDPTAPQADASAFAGQLFLTDTSRIEVLQGSGSSLYGTNAMAGVINIITQPGGGPAHGGIDVQGGGLGLFHGVARVAGGAFANRFAYSAGISNLNISSGVDSVEAARDWSGQGEAAYTLTPKIRISALLLGNAGFTQIPVSPMPSTTAPSAGIIPAIPLTTFVPSLGDPDSGVYSHYIDSLYRFEHEVTPRVSYRIGYQIVSSERDNRNGPGGAGFYQPVFNQSDKYVGRIDTVQAKANYLFGSHQVLTAGYEFEQERYTNITTDSNPILSQRVYQRTAARQRDHAAFAQDEIRLLDKRLEILLSGRFTQANLDQPTLVGAQSHMPA